MRRWREVRGRKGGAEEKMREGVSWEGRSTLPATDIPWNSLLNLSILCIIYNNNQKKFN